MKYQCVAASCMPPTGDLAHNPGMCPDWGLNQRPFGSQAYAQSTEPHQPGLCLYFLYLDGEGKVPSLSCILCGECSHTVAFVCTQSGREGISKSSSKGCVFCLL